MTLPIIALIVSAFSMLCGGAGLLLTVAAIVWRGGQIVERQAHLAQTLERVEKSLRETHHLAREAGQRVALVEARGAGGARRSR